MYFQNQVLIEGNICNDIIMNETKNGKKYCKFSVCFNKPKKISSSDTITEEWTSIPKFFNIIAWEKVAINAAKIIKKGDPVSIIGELDYSSWEDENNKKHYAVNILANQIRKFDLEKKTFKEELPSQEIVYENDNIDTETLDIV